MCPPRPSENDSEPALPPGAERFWGQMSQAKAGRSGAEEPRPEPEPDPEAEAGSEPRHGHECLEWCPICRSSELLKGVTSPEVRHQLQSIQNEALQVVKAFAAAYSERTADDPLSRRRDAEGGEAGRESKPPKPADAPIDISIE